jgi:putative membrane-bound dehydrogenase-like protein
MTASQAAASFHLPPGFVATEFASEPDVRQPVAMAFDLRGRLWVAENYTYAESGVNFATNLMDRIVILEDRDGDGRSDRRTVFWDQAKILTSVEPAVDGVYVLCPPRLLFVPDRNRDDRPDGPPEVLLDGFETTTGNRHTFANGLKTGPDGWLWGRIGISSGARVGGVELELDVGGITPA